MLRAFAGTLFATISLALPGCASDSTSSGGGPTDSFVMIGVELVRMDPTGKASDQGEFLAGISLREVTTGAVRRFDLTEGDHTVAVLPAGIYCLNELALNDTQNLTYCREPFFRLKAGEVENAGYFTFSIDFGNKQFKLNDSFSNMKGLESSLSMREKKLVERFRSNHQTEAPAATTATP